MLTCSRGAMGTARCRALLPCRLNQTSQLHRTFRTLVVAMARPWRPHIDDVDRLSRGGAAKKRGTGNRNIPHRLNADEHPVFSSAKKKGYLVVSGSGYRRARKGYPLPNIWRQWCDAQGVPCIVVEQALGGTQPSVVVVDLSPLRQLDCTKWEDHCSAAAAGAGARQLQPEERDTQDVPFDILPPAIPVALQLQQQQQGTSPSANQAPDGTSSSTGQAAQLGEAAAVAEQAEVVRRLKDAGLTNQHPEVQREVQVLLKLKQQLQMLEGSNSGDSSPPASTAADSDNSSSSAGTHPAAGPGDNSQVSEVSQDPSPSSSTKSVNTTSQAAADTEAATTSAAVAGAAGAAEAAKPGVLSEDHPYATAAIWQLPARPLFFEADRAVAKQLAKDLLQLGAGLRR